MKLKLLRMKTNALLKKNRTARTNVPYDQAKTIGIIFTVEDKQKHHVVKEFIKRFEANGKHVQILEFLPEQRDNYEFKFDFFSQKDISFWGNLSSHAAIQFCDAPFDFLYYLDLEPNPFVAHVLARSKAKCRVGRYFDEGDKYLDFMIESVSNNQALLDNMYNYTTQLK